jgi:autotransporter-associated beta strand protein
VWTNNKASLYVDATSTFKLSSGTGVQIDALSGSGTVTVGLTTGTQTLAVGANNSSSTFSGVITSGTSGAGSLSLIKTGSGTVTLTGSNSFSSGTSVMGGTLLVSNGGTLGTGNLSIANGAICSLTNTAGGLSSTASVTIGTTGALNLGTGVNLKVASLAVNGQTLANGAWNSVRDPVHFTGSGTVLVASAGATAQQDWRQSTFGTTVNTGSAADNADPDGDGVKNLMEFALGTGPLSANTTPISLSVSGGILNFTYRRSHTAEADGMVYIVEWSDTLGNDWSTTGVTQSAVSGTDDGLTQNYVATVPAGSNGRRAVRLRVTHP